jgi:hypothetical protein
MASIKCGKCGQVHTCVAAVKACHRGDTGRCNWLEWERDRYGIFRDEDGTPITRECGAFAWFDERGSYCEAGHEHISEEARHREGWTYAEDVDEAVALAKAGVYPVAMDGTGILPV